MKRLNLITVALLVTLGLTGCKKEETTEPGPPSGSENNFSIVAIVHEGGTTVFIWDSAGNPIGNATVVVNNDTLPFFFDMYFDTLVKYVKGQSYTLHADVGTYGTIDAQVTAPDIDSVRIINPSPNSQVTMGSDIPVNWNYYGGTNDKYVTLMFSYIDTTTYYTWPALSGSTTSHTIPGSAVYKNGDAYITIYAGDFVTFDDLLQPPEVQYGYVSLFGVLTGHQVNVVVAGK